MPPSDVNWVAILVTSIVGFLIGGLWYSILFGKRWIALSGLRDEQLKVGAALAYGLGFLCTFVMAYMMSRFIDYVFKAPDRTLKNGVLLALMVWVGFVATTGLMNDLFGRKPILRWLIETLHFLVVLLAMGAILGAWQ
jgi:hypothetical protein